MRQHLRKPKTLQKAFSRWTEKFSCSGEMQNGMIIFAGAAEKTSPADCMLPQNFRTAVYGLRTEKVHHENCAPDRDLSCRINGREPVTTGAAFLLFHFSIGVL